MVVTKAAMALKDGFGFGAAFLAAFGTSNLGAANLSYFSFFIYYLLTTVFF